MRPALKSRPRAPITRGVNRTARSVTLPLAALAGAVLVARFIGAVAGSGYYGVWEAAG